MKVVTLLLLIPVSIVLKAWVSVRLWLWFVVAIGAEPISMPVAFGLSTLVTLWTYVPPKQDENERFKVDVPRAIAMGIALPLFALLLGWIAKQLM